MTEQEVTALGPAFASYRRRFRGHLGQERTAGHFGTFCRGLLSDLPRKSIEPIALEAGTAVRTPQEFRVTARWDHVATRDTLPADPVGTVGVIDETRCRKWGDHTPRVQRQYLGCVGKVGNGIVTVHIGVTEGTFQALSDADPFVPESWAADRNRCDKASTPDDIGHRTEWRLAVGQWLRATGNGLPFDRLTFDQGYGAAVPFLTFLNVVNQRFMAGVPVSFAVRDTADGRSRRADARLPAADAGSGTRHRVAHRAVPASFGRVATAAVWVADRAHTLVVAVNESTDEVKYFLTDATTATRARVRGVGFRRWAVEHAFRLGEQEAGLMDDEGRSYVGRMRHLTLALIALGFVATHTQRLRGDKSAGHGRAGVPGPEPAVRGGLPSEPRHSRHAAYQSRHLLPPSP